MTTTRCEICDFEFSTEAKSEQDRLDHIIQHTRFKKALHELREQTGQTYMPRNRELRDTIAKESKKLLAQTSLKARKRGASKMLRRYFDRSLHEALLHGYHLQHPDLKTYISMAFMHVKQLPDDVKEYLKEEFGIQPNEIAPGFSNWYPPGSEERKQQFQEYERYAGKTTDGEYQRPLSLLERKEMATKRFCV